MSIHATFSESDAGRNFRADNTNNIQFIRSLSTPSNENDLHNSISSVSNTNTGASLPHISRYDVQEEIFKDLPEDLKRAINDKAISRNCRSLCIALGVVSTIGSSEDTNEIIDIASAMINSNKDKNKENIILGRVNSLLLKHGELGLSTLFDRVCQNTKAEHSVYYSIPENRVAHSNDLNHLFTGVMSAFHLINDKQSNMHSTVVCLDMILQYLKAIDITLKAPQNLPKENVTNSLINHDLSRSGPGVVVNNNFNGASPAENIVFSQWPSIPDLLHEVLYSPVENETKIQMWKITLAFLLGGVPQFYKYIKSVDGGLKITGHDADNKFQPIQEPTPPADNITGNDTENKLQPIQEPTPPANNITGHDTENKLQPIQEPTPPADNIPGRDAENKLQPIKEPTPPADNIPGRDAENKLQPIKEPSPPADNIIGHDTENKLQPIQEPTPTADNITGHDTENSLQPIQEPNPPADNITGHDTENKLQTIQEPTPPADNITGRDAENKLQPIKEPTNNDQTTELNPGILDKIRAFFRWLWS